MIANGVSASFDQNASLSYVAVSSRQDNALNQDFNGLDGDDNTLDLDQSYRSLGAISAVYTADGTFQAIPEPSIVVMTLCGFALLFGRRTRRV